MAQQYESERVFAALEQAIRQLAKEKDKFVLHPGKDFTRDRKLSFTDTILAYMKFSGDSLTSEVQALRLNGGLDVTKSAISQRIAKIKPEAGEELLRLFNENALIKPKTDKGHRVFAVDGSDINIAHNPNTPAAMVGSKKLSSEEKYSQLHLNAVFDLINGIYLDAIIQPKQEQDEVGAAWQFMDRMNNSVEPRIFIMDRGYESYNTLAHAVKSPNTYVVQRVKSDKNCMKFLQDLEQKELDVDKTFTLNNRQTKAAKKAGHILLRTGSTKGKDLKKDDYARFDYSFPFTMTIRVVRFRLSSGEYETLLTNLPRDEFSADDLRELYWRRWGIETSFRELKYAVGAVNMHTRRISTSALEIFLSLVKFNLTEFIVTAIGETKYTAKHAYRINHKIAVVICLTQMRLHNRSWEEIEVEIKRNIEIYRPGRPDTRKTIVPKTFVYFTYRTAA